jgi:threonine dehydratase
MIPDFVRRTPLVFAPALNAWLKLESLQLTGSFKLRGAALRLQRLDGDARARGVVTASAGSHGLGLALAGARLGVPVTACVPASAPAVKRDGIARHGAHVVIVDGGYQEAEARAHAIAAERGVPFVSAYEDDDVIEGNGATLGRELLGQHARLERVIVPVGGGGLLHGLIDALPASVEIVGAQPETNCALHESLQIGRALVDYRGGATLCEGLEGGVGARNYEAARARRVRVALASEDEILAAIGFAWRALGVVIEASAAVAVAIARAGRASCDEATALVITGGNIDAALLDRAIARFDRGHDPGAR